MSRHNVAFQQTAASHLSLFFLVKTALHTARFIKNKLKIALKGFHYMFWPKMANNKHLISSSCKETAFFPIIIIIAINLLIIPYVCLYRQLLVALWLVCV
jgi:hypothetical protein